MRAHLKYLRYVLAHKFYVLRAGLYIHPIFGADWREAPRMIAWLWRLLVHDWSKFLPSEWTPYVQMFYGTMELRRDGQTLEQWQACIAAQKRDRQAAFNAAWLHHIHFNPHHWQHHILHQDDGRTLVLVPPAVLADEMVADWLAAGPKALRLHSMQQAVIETIQWYAKNHSKMQLRTVVRARVERILLELAALYGLDQHANDVRATAETRVALMADIR